jgi:hypothetical protein
MKIPLDRDLLEKVAETQLDSDRRRLVDQAVRTAIDDLEARAERAETEAQSQRAARMEAEDEAARRSGLLAETELQIADLNDRLTEERALRTAESMSAARARRRTAEVTKMRNYFAAALLLVAAASGLVFPVAFGLVSRPLGLTFLVFAAVLACFAAVGAAFRVPGLLKLLVAVGGLLGLLVGIYELFVALFQYFQGGRSG